MLGDHVYRSYRSESCARQLIDVHQQVDTSVIAVEADPIADCTHRGCVTGQWRSGSSTLLDITEIYEKPTVDYARQHLQMEGLPAESVLAIFGLYLLPPDIFQYLAADIRQNQRDRGEFQLTTSLERLRQDQGMAAYQVDGRSFDMGQPRYYRETIAGYGVPD